MIFIFVSCKCVCGGCWCPLVDKSQTAAINRIYWALCSAVMNYAAGCLRSLHTNNSAASSQDHWIVFWCFVCLRQISVIPELRATLRTSPGELVWLHIYVAFNWSSSELLSGCFPWGGAAEVFKATQRLWWSFASWLRQQFFPPGQTRDLANLKEKHH